MIGRTRIGRLINRAGHLVAVRADDSALFGRTYQPECVEDDCGYLGPFVSESRAYAIAEEHRRKSAGIWSAVR